MKATPHAPSRRPYLAPLWTYLILPLVLLSGALGQQFNLTTPLNEARTLHTATLLLDGRVLIVGGGNGSADISSCEIYEPATGAVVTTASTNLTRAAHAATRLADGRVLVAGGDGYTNTLEIYDPAMGIWGTPQPMPTGRAFFQAVTLSNGEVVLIGGFPNPNYVSSVDVYDPNNGSWRSLPDMNTGRSFHSANVLSGDRILVIGGWGSPAAETAEMYDPNTNSWTTFSLTGGGGFGCSTVLADGRVLSVGGYSTTLGGYPTISEIFDPVTQTFSTSGSISQGRYGCAASLLPDGRVLLTGGVSSSVTADAEIYDPSTGIWSSTGSMNEARSWHQSVMTSAGMVVFGGQNGGVVGSNEVYAAENPPSYYFWSPSDTYLQLNPGETSNLTSTLYFHDGSNGTDNAVTGEYVTAAVDLGNGSLYPAFGYTDTNGQFSVSYTHGTGEARVGFQSQWGTAQASFHLTETPQSYYFWSPNNTTIETSVGNNTALGSTLYYHDGSSGTDSTVSSAYVSVSIQGNGSTNQSWGYTDGNGYFQVDAVRYSDNVTVTFSAYDGTAEFILIEPPPPPYYYWTNSSGGGVMVDNTSTTLSAQLIYHDSNGSEYAAVAQYVNVSVSGNGSSNPSWGYTDSSGYFTTTYTHATGNDAVTFESNTVTTSFEIVGATSSFVMVSPLNEGRTLHTATLLLDGRILIAGGTLGSAYENQSVASCEIYDPVADTMTYTGSMGVARAFHSATRLADGRVLAAGGDGYINTMEIYDPTTGLWGPLMSTPHGMATQAAGLLSTGEVAFIGGWPEPYPVARVELFNPSTGAWASLPDMNAGRSLHTAVVLSGDRILAVGGWGTPAAETAEMYNPSTGTWTTFSLTGGGGFGTTTVLADGRVLIAGGYSTTLGTYPTTTEIFDPATQTLATTGSISQGRYGCAASLLADGRVLLTGGLAAGTVSEAEIYDPVTGNWASAGPLNAPRGWHQSVLTAVGVVILGGQDAGGAAVGSTEIYVP